MTTPSKSNGPIIAVDGLSVGFRSRAGAWLPVLRDITLSVGAGESLGWSAKVARAKVRLRWP